MQLDEGQKRRILNRIGWAAVAVSTLITTLWTLWGVLENFHEGWFYASLLGNLALMIAQYLSLPLVFLLFGMFALRWPATGCLLHFGAGVAALFAIRNPFVVLPFVAAPLFGIGLLYFFGRPEPRKLAYRILWGVPLAAGLVAAIEPAIRVAGRIDDGNYGIRRLAGPLGELEWAPEGPGWPQEGVSWEEAARRCRYLSADGSQLLETPQNLWRLPTTHELVGSLTRGGKNAGGLWDESSRTPHYKFKPDKETPLWKVRSPIIYYWSADAHPDDDSLAFFVCFNGAVNSRPKVYAPGYQSFRAVRGIVRDSVRVSEEGPAVPK